MNIKQLENGLKYIVVPNPSSEVVSLQVWIGCGSIYEDEREYGLSHFIEHLLFKGTRNHKLGEVAQTVEKLGGELNAFTSMEYTCYYMNFPSMYAKQGLSTLFDLVYCPLFDGNEINNEREVVLEEIRRSKDIPNQVAVHNFFKIHFEEHPYSMPVLGFEDIIRSVPRETILDYYSRFYVPENSLLVVCGNIGEKEAEKNIKEIFSELKASLFEPAQISKHEKKTHFTSKIENMEVVEANFATGFSIPDFMHEDAPALDILALILGQGDSSHLVRSLRLEKALVTSIYSSAYTPRYAGAFFIGFTMEGSGDTFVSRLTEVFDSIFQNINNIGNGLFQDDEIDKAKTILMSEKVYEKETVEGYGRKLGSIICITGGMDFERIYFERLAKVERKDVIYVLKKYMNANGLSISSVLPKTLEFNEEQLKELILSSASKNMNNGSVGNTAKEKNGKTNEDQYSSRLNKMLSEDTQGFSTGFEIEKPELIKHKSGAKIILRHISSTPLVSLRIIFPGGVLYEDKSQLGISNVLSRTWLYGTKDIPFIDIADHIDKTASTLNAFSGRNSIGITMEALKPFLPSMLDLLNKLIVSPLFEEEYFLNEKSTIENDIKSMQDNPSYYLGILLLKTIYKTHPYRFETTGTLETLSNINRDEVIKFYQSVLVPSRMVISVVGDFNKEDILEWIDQTIDSLTYVENDLPLIPKDEKQSSARKTTYNKDVNQAHITLAYKTCDIKSKDRNVLRLISSVLSGQSGRLFMNLRDKQSLAYTVSPVLMFGPEPGYFGVYIAGEPSKIEQSIESIKKEIEILKTEAIPKQELERAKNYILGRHVLGLQRFGEQSIQMAFDELYGLGYDSMFDFSREIMSISAKDIQKAAKKYFNKDKECLAIISNSFNEEA